MLGGKNWLLEGTCLILEAVCFLFNVVCLCLSTSYVLLMHYLAFRFTYFLDWLMLSLFLGPKPSVLPFGSALLTFTNSHQRLSQLPPSMPIVPREPTFTPRHQLKSIASYPCSAYCNSGLMPSVTGGGMHSS